MHFVIILKWGCISIGTKRGCIYVGLKWGCTYISLVFGCVCICTFRDNILQHTKIKITRKLFIFTNYPTVGIDKLMLSR